MAENTKNLITGIYHHNDTQTHLEGTLWGAVQAVQYYSDHLSINRNTDDASADENRFKRLTSGANLGSRGLPKRRRSSAGQRRNAGRALAIPTERNTGETYGSPNPRVGVKVEFPSRRGCLRPEGDCQCFRLVVGVCCREADCVFRALGE